MNIPKLNSSDTAKFMTEHNNLVSKKEKISVQTKKSAADSFEHSKEVSLPEKGYENYSKIVSDNGQDISYIDDRQEQDAEIGEEKNSAQSAPKQEDQTGREEAAGDQTGSSGCVGINAGKLARMLAAAKTRSQVQAVIAKIQADLRECEAGKNNGMDVDEASVKAAEQLLVEAKSRMGSAENREATPEEEMAAALASIM